MAVDNPKVLDAADINDEAKLVYLLIEDKFPWTDGDIPETEHLKMLERKINAYLNLWNSGEIHNIIPQSTEYGMAVDIRFTYKLPPHVEKVVNAIGLHLKELGIPLRYYVYQVI